MKNEPQNKKMCLQLRYIAYTVIYKLWIFCITCFRPKTFVLYIAWARWSNQDSNNLEYLKKNHSIPHNLTYKILLDLYKTLNFEKSFSTDKHA